MADERADAILHEARHLHAFDPEFHALVELSARVMFATHDQLDHGDTALIATVAAVALTLSRHELSELLRPSAPGTAPPRGA
jgi:hypothetical protein